MFGSRSRNVDARLAQAVASERRARSLHNRATCKLRNMFDASGRSRKRRDKRDEWRGMFQVEFDAAQQERARSLSRVMHRNSSAYRAPIRAAVDEIIGAGLLPIGRTPEAQQAVALFTEWANDPKRCDIQGMRTLGQIQRSRMRATLIDGDQLELFTNRGSLQQIPSHRIVQPNRKVEHPRLAGGIAVDAVGAPEAFYIAPWMKSGRALDYAKAKAYPVASASFLNCPDEDFEGLRTPPLLIAGMLRIQDVEGYTDKVTVAAKWAAALCGFIVSEDPLSASSGLQDGTESTTGTTQADDDERRTIEMVDGMFAALERGDDIKQIDAKQPMARFEIFVQQLMRFACAGIGLPYEVAMLDYSRANFSVTKQVQMQAERFANPWRQMFVERALLPEYRWMLDRFIAEGRLPATPAFRRAALDVDVPPPPHRVIDEQKENAAAAMAIEHNLLTLEEYHTPRRRDWRKVVKQRGIERRMEEEEGVRSPSIGEGQPGVPQVSREGLDNDDDVARSELATENR